MLIPDFLKQLPHQKRPFACLIGEKTYYSLSPLMHQTAAKFHQIEFDYFGLDVAEKEFHLIKKILENPLCVGLNCTIPYKNTILSLVDEQDELVQKLQAANVIHKKNGKIIATNTDVIGFMYPLKSIKSLNDIRYGFVFGSGGASKAAMQGLELLGIQNCFIISRNPTENELSYSNWVELLPANEQCILVNGSPLGMTINKDKSPIQKEIMAKINPRICYDLVYNPAETTFLRFAKELEIEHRINGLDMLIKQGSEAFFIWNKKQFPFPKIKNACLAKLAQK